MNGSIDHKSDITGVNTLGHFLFSHLRDKGIGYIFGIPGDYILSLFRALEETPELESVVSAHEPGAAFSADAYGRIKGLGVLLVTYGVGGFNTMNGVACAYAESSPLLVVSGGPPVGRSEKDNYFSPQVHHFVKHKSSQLEAFRHITDLVIRIESADTAAHDIKRAVDHAMTRKLPVYLEIPTNLMNANIIPPGETIETGSADPEYLNRAVAHFIQRIDQAENPVIIAGYEVGRYGLQDEVLDISKNRRIPVATSILGKGIFSEATPGVMGSYAGVISQSTAIRDVVESADLVLLFGVKVTDTNCGAFTANLEKEKLLIAQNEWIGDGFMKFAGNISIPTFIKKLSQLVHPKKITKKWPEIPKIDLSKSEILIDRYMAAINDVLTDESVVIADTGDSCYGSQFMNVRRRNGYMAPTFYNSMGFAVPAALGVQLADPQCRPVVLVGDGAFQMTGTEMSTMVKWNLNPVIVVFNNNGYGMQRIFVDGPFNNINQWNYTKMTDMVGGGTSWKVSTAEEMKHALSEAFSQNSLALIEAASPRGEVSTGLNTFGKALLREKSGVCPLNEENSPCRHQERCGFCRATIWK